jgi:hypothetical protein
MLRKNTRDLYLSKKKKYERFTAHYIPRSPMARAHRTVKRPEEINHRIKLPTEKKDIG